MRLYLLLASRSFQVRPLRTLLSGFGIVLGVAAILAINLTNRTAIRSVTDLFQNAAGKASLSVASAETGGQGFPDRTLETLRRHPGVALAAPSITLPALLPNQARSADVSISLFGMGAGGLLLQGVDPQLDPQVRVYTLAEGRLPEGDDSDEIALAKDFALDNELALDEMVEVALPSGIASLRLVGLLEKEGPAQQNGGAFGVLPLLTAQKLSGREGKLDQVDLVVTDALADQEALDDLRLALQSRLGDDYAVTYPAAQGQRMTQMLSNYQIGLNFLSGMTLFVGAFLIFNAFSMTVVERTRQFAMLRTVGMTRRQVMALVLGEAFLLGVICSLLGLALGVALAAGLSRVMGVMLAADLDAIRSLPGSAALGGFLVGLGVSLLASAVPALQAGRVSPLEALRLRAQVKEGWLVRRGWIPGLVLLLACTAILVLNPFPYDVQFRLGSMFTFGLFLGGALLIPAVLNLAERPLRPLAALLFGSSGKLGSANIRRARARSALTTATLMIGVAMIVIVWAITDSFKDDLDAWLQGFIGGDIYITSSIPMGRDVQRRLEAVPGVEAVAPVRYFNVKWQPGDQTAPGAQQEDLLFMAFEPSSYGRVSSFIFHAAEPDAAAAMQRLSAGEGVFVSTVLAERYKLQPGSTVRLLTRTGPRDFPVLAVVVDYYNQGLVVKGSWQDMNRRFRLDGANTFLLKVQPGSSAAQIAAEIDRLYGERDSLVINTNQSLLARISGLMAQAFSLFDVLALITMLVGFFGVTNTLTMNVLERTRELGMLRSIGMTRSQVLRMVLAEAAVLGLIGSVMGVIFGAILARIFMAAMTAMSGYQLAFVFPLQKALLALLIGLLTTQVAALFPGLRATRLRLLEAIQYE